MSFKREGNRKGKEEREKEVGERKGMEAPHLHMTALRKYFPMDGYFTGTGSKIQPQSLFKRMKQAETPSFNTPMVLHFIFNGKQ